MRFVADLHVHSRFSRACSRDGDLEHLAWWGARKGITVLGTGDLTHPAWAAEIRDRLVPAEPGLFRLRPDLEADVLRTLPASCRTPVRFQLSVEISTIYKRADRTRKVHHLVYLPDLAAADEFTRRLARVGNLASDGRPILGLDSRDLLETTLDSGDGGYLVPAHVWTPWFAALGSKSGFDAVADCYADLAEHVFAVETGLSSDPAMNWRVSSLDAYRLVSSSDAHSPPALGREATELDTELSYGGIREALRTGAGLAGTIEFFPEEGKYHLDGHRRCGVRLDPAETQARDGRCPGCGGPVTVGVLHRVEALADRPEGFRPDGAPPFTRLVQLPQVVGEIRGVGPRSKAVSADVAALVARFGPELTILRETPLDEVARASSPVLADALGRLRRGEVLTEGGFDGEYGVVRLFHPKELADAAAPGLFDLEPVPTLFGAVGPEPSGTDPVAAVPVVPVRAAAARGGTGRGRVDGPGENGPGEDRPAVDGPGEDEGASGPLAGLDPDQRAAAEAVDGPLLVVAGPGTGKTRTLTARIAHLLVTRGAEPEQVLAVTFTRRAAEEMRERLERLVPGTADRIPVTTFHGLGLRLLRENAERCGLTPLFRVTDDADRLVLLREAAGEPAGGGRRDLARLAGEVSAAARSTPPPPPGPTRQAGWAPAAGDAADPQPTGELAGMLARYRAGKRARDLVDLDDLVTMPVALLAADPELAAAYRQRWPWLCVDEYQDVDAAQYRLLRLLVRPDGNLCAIGDPDQAIYAFRGADVGFFLRFGQDFPAARTVTLSRNYRSSTAVVSAALQVVAPSTLVPGRDLVPVAEPPGSPDRVVLHLAADERAEAGYVVDTVERLIGGTSLGSLDRGRADGQDSIRSFSDVAVLYRTDAQARPLTEALEAAGIPHQKRSHLRLADQPGVRDVLLAMRAQPAAWAAEPRPVLARVRAAAQSAMDAAGGLAALSAAEALADDGWAAVLDSARAVRALPSPRSGDDERLRSPDEVATARAVRVGAVRSALELLGPLAERAGTDVGGFLAELAVGAEVDVWDPRADRVSLLTLHAAKGLEFPAVLVVGCEEDLLPMRFGGSDLDPDAVAEERRLLFVGMTRARSRLVLTAARRRSGRGGPRDARPSRFLSDIADGLLERSSALPARPRTVQLRLL